MKQFVALLSALAVFCASGAQAADLDAAFDIIRKGDRIGFHAVDVETTADGGVTVNTRIEMKVKFGPVPVFKYQHVSTETWRDGKLQSVESTTDNNGKDEFLRVKRDGDKLLVEGTRYTGPAPSDAIPSSYWNKDIVSTKTLLDTQNGRLIDVTIANLGETASPTGETAEQHRLTGSVDLNLWYDGPRWVGADFVVRGQALTYRLVDGAERERLFAQLNFNAGR
jgi:hypothetical protein